MKNNEITSYVVIKFNYILAVVWLIILMFFEVLSLRAISGAWALVVKWFLCPSIFHRSCSLIFSLASYNLSLIVMSHLFKTHSSIYSQKAILIVSSWCPQQSDPSLFVTTVGVKYLPCPNCSNVEGDIQQITDLKC